MSQKIAAHATPGAPQAIGPYSQSVSVNGFLFTSGQIALDPASGEMANADFETEARRVLANLGAVLESAGCGFQDVVKATVYLADMNDFATVNEIYGTYFSSPAPARATVQAARLPRDARVEIDLIASL